MVTPDVTSSISTSSVASRGQVRVTARYFNPETGDPMYTGWVRLEYNRGGKWGAASAAKVDENGTVNLYDRPPTSVSYRMVFLGNGGYTSKASTTYRVTVRKSGAGVLAEAKRHTGALYKFAASGPSRFDCSGFTKYVYKKAAGKSLPHKANLQQRYGVGVAKNKAQVGDLIVFRSGSYGSHVGIYAGAGYMYDSPHTGARVGKHKIYGGNYVVRRLV